MNAYAPAGYNKFSSWAAPGKSVRIDAQMIESDGADEAWAVGTKSVAVPQAGNKVSFSLEVETPSGQDHVRMTLYFTLKTS